MHFVLDAEDDQADPRVGSQVAQKMVDAKVAGVVGHFNSGTTIPASRIYNTAGIPMVSPTATNPTLTSQGFGNVFRVVNSDAQMGQLAGHSAVEALKGKSIAVIDDRFVTVKFKGTYTGAIGTSPGNFQCEVKAVQ